MKRKIYGIILVSISTIFIISTMAVAGIRTYTKYNPNFKEADLVIGIKDLPGYDTAPVITNYWYRLDGSFFPYECQYAILELDKYMQVMYSKLFTYGNKIYLEDNSANLFRMDYSSGSNKIKWSKVIGYKPIIMTIKAKNYWYGIDFNQKDSCYDLYYINEEKELIGDNWQKVITDPKNKSIIPKSFYKSMIYGVSTTFSNSYYAILRSSDIGNGVMKWVKVLESPKPRLSPQSEYVEFMTAMNGKIYVVVKPYEGKSIKILESPNGDEGTWTETVFTDLNSFGIDDSVYAPFSISCWSVYKGAKQKQEYLYMGINCWPWIKMLRYDGTGTKGWADVTPPWIIPIPKKITCSNSFTSMAVLKDNLYVTASIDQTAGLATYDGWKWSVLISGPDVFNDPDNEWPCSLTALGERLYILVKHITSMPPYYYYNQVWGCPFEEKPVIYQNKTR